jgi:hypothetical protein
LTASGTTALGSVLPLRAEDIPGRCARGLMRRGEDVGHLPMPCSNAAISVVLVALLPGADMVLVAATPRTAG